MVLKYQLKIEALDVDVLKKTVLRSMKGLTNSLVYPDEEIFHLKHGYFYSGRRTVEL